MCSGTLLNQFLCCCIFCSPGYMIGYISHRKPQVQPVNCGTELTTEIPLKTTPAFVVASAPEPQLEWKDITQLLDQKLTSQAFDRTLRYVVHVLILKPVHCHHTKGEAKRGRTLNPEHTFCIARRQTRPLMQTGKLVSVILKGLRQSGQMWHAVRRLQQNKQKITEEVLVAALIFFYHF